MCGIVGYFGSMKFSPTDNKIKNCLKLMQNGVPIFIGLKIKLSILSCHIKDNYV